MCIVLEGNGEVENLELGKFNLEELRAYYLMPELKARVSNGDSKDLLIFIANCDI